MTGPGKLTLCAIRCAAGAGSSGGTAIASSRMSSEMLQHTPPSKTPEKAKIYRLA